VGDTIDITPRESAPHPLEHGPEPVRAIGTVGAVNRADRLSLGWGEDFDAAWAELGRRGQPSRVSRLDRGWSTLLVPADAGYVYGIARVRNIGIDVAVGDWVLASPDGERIEHIIRRRSAFVRRASFEGARAQSHTIAANVDTVFLCHSFGVPPNQRRLERELILAFDSGAEPAVLLTKGDLVEDPEPARRELQEVALGVPVLVTSGRTEGGLGDLIGYVRSGRTVAFLGASGVGKSTLVNELLGSHVQQTTEVRGDQRGRHTTVAAELLAVPSGGWLIDTPGVRALSLWHSGQGIERAFADVFELMDRCRFRDCKHDQEPGCAVLDAIENGTLDPDRFRNLERLVAEEAALEAEQRAKEKHADRRRVPRAARNIQPGTQRPPDE
jgi:ribosome biogenesis GTPase